MLKKEMWKPVCEAWYSEAPNVLEEIDNLMTRRITDLIIAKGDTKKYRLYDVGIQYCCVLIGIYLKCAVVFHSIQKKTSKNDQEIPQSHTVERPTAPRGRATKH